MTYSRLAGTLIPGLTAVLIASSPAPSIAGNCPVLPPPVCSVEDQFPAGRWDISEIQGDYSIGGEEVFDVYANDPDAGGVFLDVYRTDGLLTAEMVGGPTQNYIEVECDGTVTGQASELITGTVEKIAQHPFDYYNADFCFPVPFDMSWDVTIDRTYAITGQVTGEGELELDYDVHTAAVSVSGNYAWSDDCIFIEDPISGLDGFDLSGNIERVRLSGLVDPITGVWTPEINPREAETWVDDILHRLRINGAATDTFPPFVPSLDPAGSTQPSPQRHNRYFVQDSVVIDDDITAEAEPKQPVVTDLSLAEPRAYLLDVSAPTRLIVEIDWRGQPPGEVRFTYGATTETVAGADTVIWEFDAGDPGDEIETVAILDGIESLPNLIATPKVPLSQWAGGPGDWQALGGITYDATLDWPLTFDATRGLSGIPLFNGDYGFGASLTSIYEARTFSNGSPGAGTLDITASARFAGRTKSLTMNGDNTTTLGCDVLETEGDASAELPTATWQKTVNPITLVPGLETAACALSGFLCDVIGSFGIKGTGNATLGGSATYRGSTGPIEWTSGSLNGELGGGVSLGAGLPTPIGSIASVRVYGSATGCIEVQVAPSPNINTLGGALEVGAGVSFLGASSQVDESLPFGDGCTRAPAVPAVGNTGWIDADGQPAMAATNAGGDTLGAAAWSALPAGQIRPAGRIDLRMYADGLWGPTVSINSGSDAARAPSVAFDTTGRLIVSYMRNAAAPPADPLDPGAQAAYANGYELAWSRFDPDTGQIDAEGVLTQNALTDFAPSLVTDSAGGLHLFWQRADGIEITGTPTSPTSLHAAAWDADAGLWSPAEIVSDGLSWTFGWTAAARSSEERIVVLVEDTDADYRTEADREIVAIIGTASGWNAPMPLTSNARVDDSPHAYYDESGVPQVVWRAGNEALQSPAVAPAAAPAFTTPDPATDDGISAAFSRARTSIGSDGPIVWSEDGKLLVAEYEDSSWTPAVISGTADRAVRPLSVYRNDGLVVIGIASAAPGLAGRNAPMDAEFLVFDDVFSDGFEAAP